MAKIERKDIVSSVITDMMEQLGLEDLYGKLWKITYSISGGLVLQFDGLEPKAFNIIHPTAPYVQGIEEHNGF